MSFRLQLKLLLWKNFTLKKRSPIVVLLELVIPLVLFFILLGIRRRQPAYKVATSRFEAWPLPSAGIMPMMQMFCEQNGLVDEHGFMNYPNSSSYEFLANLNRAAKRRNFFEPDFTPSDLDDMPESYQRVVEDPLNWKHRLLTAPDVPLRNVTKPAKPSDKPLFRNCPLNISVSNAGNATLRTKELYQILFESSAFETKTRGNETYLTIFNTSTVTGDDLSSLSRNPCVKLLTGERLKKLAEKTGIVDPDSENGQSVVGTFVLEKLREMQSSDDGDGFWIELQCILELTAESHSRNRLKAVIAGAIMRALTDDNAASDPNFLTETLMEAVLTPEVLRDTSCHGQWSHLFEMENIDKMENCVCNMSESDLNTFSRELGERLNSTAVAEVLRLDEINMNESAATVKAFVINLEKYTVFRDTLEEFALVAQELPQDECSSIWVSDYSAGTSNRSSEEYVDMNNRTYYVPSSNLTSGFLKLWSSMKKIVCGERLDRIPMRQEADKPRSEVNLDDLGLSYNQKINAKLFVSLFMNNPKVLYAPMNTTADSIIKKANTTFALAMTITEYAKAIVNVSEAIDNYLSLNTTSKNLEELQRIQTKLKPKRSLLKSLGIHSLDEFLNRDAVPDSQAMRSQLAVTRNAACSWVEVTKAVNLHIFKGFRDEASLVKYFLSDAYRENVTVFASIVFNMNPDGSLPNHMVYKIRQNTSFTTTTKGVRTLVWSPGPRNWDYSYYNFGFLWLQDIFERAMIDLYAERDVVEPGSYVHQFPYPCYILNNFVFMIEHILPMCSIISWVYWVAMLVQGIVYEKEQRLREVMKTMGLTNNVHWLAWFITSFCQMTLTMIILTMVLKWGDVLSHSNPIIIFIILEIFGAATIVFSFLISTFYSKAKVAAACAGIIYFITYVPFLYISIREEATHVTIPGWAKGIASLCSTTAFGLGAKYFAHYELEGIGCQWHNIAHSPLEGDSFSLLHVIAVMLVDIVIYGVLMWYVENVFPGQYGLPKPWYFPFRRKRYRHLSKAGGHRRSHSADLHALALDNFGQESGDEADAPLCEAEPVGLKLGVKIVNLSKRYRGQERPAVDRLSLNMYEGQIMAFLGHNGAGKTTTMSILTGLFPSSAGTAIIYDCDIYTQIDEIRKSMGTCPQYNVLFDKLTVEEHLWFYARLKGMSYDDVRTEVNKLIVDLALPEKRSSLVDALSGGMKRKLSVAIAFIGGSRTVILDEPTAGVDPYARRAIWDLILRYKPGRTILLSTHHMDEADFVGDRIAIIAQGRLRCYGSPLFVKSTLGEGYHLTFVKQLVTNRDKALQAADQMPFTSQADPLTVQCHLKKFGRSVTMVDETLHELRFNLPGWTGEQMIALLNSVETPQVLKQLHLQSYGLRDSTLEEIFLKVSNLSPAESGRSDTDKDSGFGSVTASDNPHEPRRKMSDNENMETDVLTVSENLRHPMFVRLDGRKLQWRQFCAVMQKRWWYSRRNFRALVSQILLPILFVVVAMSVALTVALIEEAPPIELSPAQYYNFTRPDGNVVVFSNVAGSKQDDTCSLNATGCVAPERMVDSLYAPAGISATCLLLNPKIDLDVQTWNTSGRSYAYLRKFFIPQCERVFANTLPSRSLLPQIKDEEIAGDNTTIDEITEHYYPNCMCARDGAGLVCSRYGFVDPPTTTLITAEVLHDITGQNDSEYYLYTTERYRLRRYGAFAFGHSLKQVPGNFGIGAPTTFRKIAVGRVSKVWYDNTGYHAMPIYLNALNNALLRASLPKRKGNPSAYGITLFNHPMEGTNERFSPDKILQGTDVIISMFIVTAMSFVPASFVLYLVNERYTKAKHLQFLAGMSPVMYWLANLLFDIISYLIPAACCCCILRIFAIPALVSDWNFAAVIALFLLYGLSITPLMYPATFYFHEPSTAYIAMIVLNLFIGITCIMTSFMLQVFSTANDHFNQVHETLKMIFLVFPSFGLGRGLMDIAFNHYMNEYFIMTGQSTNVQSPFQWEVVNRNLCAMFAVGLIAFALTIILEFRRCRMRKTNDELSNEYLLLPDDEVDVARERQRILSCGTSNDIVRVKNLTKIYKSRKLGEHLAVEQLCFGVPKGECFGLLGVNGAGKTTTFSMLTGDTTITSGDAFFADRSIVSDLRQAQAFLGYCPQFDALYEELTAAEHLKLFCMIRGIPSCLTNKVVSWALKTLNLTKYADKETQTYSGGTKRKLSIAVALVGDPDVIMLDEPTTGMDPLNRRFLWDIVIALTKAGKSVIFTSHSMEECEALCTRLAIMVNGRFKCLGSIQHLKNNYGNGYSIRLRLKTSSNGSDKRVVSPAVKLQQAVQAFFNAHLCEATLKELHFNYVHYEINALVNLSKIFRVCEQLVRTLPVESYSISQNTLDNVFVSFAQHQGDHANRSRRRTRASSRNAAFPLDDRMVNVQTTELRS